MINLLERRPCFVCGKEMFRFWFYLQHFIWCWPFDNPNSPYRSGRLAEGPTWRLTKEDQ